MMENHHMPAAGNAMGWKLVEMGGVGIIYLIRLLVLAILLTPGDLVWWQLLWPLQHFC